MRAAQPLEAVAQSVVVAPTGATTGGDEEGVRVYLNRVGNWLALPALGNDPADRIDQKISVIDPR